MSEERAPIYDVPMDDIGHIFSAMDHETAQNFRKCSKGLNWAYKHFRSSIEGPRCTAIITHIDNNLTFQISDNSDHRPPMVVSSDQWPFYFTNATVMMFILSDSNLPIEEFDQLCCFKTLHTVYYNGITISQELLNAFDRLVAYPYFLSVQEWTPGLAAPTKLHAMDVQTPIRNLQNVTNVMKAVSTFEWTIEFDDFEQVMTDLEENFADNEINVKQWTVNVENAPPPIVFNTFVDLFINQVRRISTHLMLLTVNNGTKITIARVDEEDEEEWEDEEEAE